MPTVTSLRLALFYVAIFVVFGVQIPFWPLWLGARGLSAEELGVLFAVGQWVKAAANPLAGMAPDRRGEPRRIMLLLSCPTPPTFLFCLVGPVFPPPPPLSPPPSPLFPPPPPSPAP